MDKSSCASCRSPKGIYTCGKCEGAVCKQCLQILPKNSFNYLEPLPKDLTHKNYCANCYTSYVGPSLDEYSQTLAQAKQVMVFHKGLGEETRLMSRSEKPLKIESNEDKAEALLKLAYLAAKGGWNSLIDVEVISKKVRNAGFQTSSWHAIGIPLTLDRKKYEKK